MFFFSWPYAARVRNSNVQKMSFQGNIARFLEKSNVCPGDNEPPARSKKEIRNNPVNAITNFFPTDDVKNSENFINQKRRCEKFDAKIASERQIRAKNFMMPVAGYWLLV